MKSILSEILVFLITVLGIVTTLLAPFYTWLEICLQIFLVLSFITYLCLKLTPKKNENIIKFARFFSIIIFTLVVLEIIFYIFYLTGILEHFRDIESAKNYIQSFGAISWIIYFIIQFLQVVILPLPAQITMITGVLIFGPVQTFLISSVAVVLGSLVCFAVGRGFGNKILYLLFKKETVNHYKELLSKRGRLLLPIFFLLPIFPDDLLCFAAGATNMTFKCFLMICLIFRTLAVACVCWISSGKLIPFSSWGIPVWIGLLVLFVSCLFFLFKYQKNIEDWIVKKVSKIKK